MECTDTEQRILDMWPKFEDGSYVQLGDSYIDTDDDDNQVMAIEFNDRCTDLVGLEGFHTGFDTSSERVKRPAPKVLDADGVEIKAGDTVWHVYGSEWLVEELNRYGVRCFDGAKRRTFSPTFLTHTRPDSWERLEEDIAKQPCLIAEEVKGSKFDSCSECPWPSEVIARNIVRRAKALADKEAGR